MSLRTCLLLLGLQFTTYNAVLLSDQEDTQIQKAYPNLKTRPRIARKLRQGKTFVLFELGESGSGVLSYKNLI